MSRYLIKSGLIVNRGTARVADLLIVNDRIERIDDHIEDDNATVIDASGKWVIPGIIDDQVHFREPGLTHKANIYTEAKAAVAGGVCSFMEMPNTKPSCLTQELLADKYEIGRKTSLANYSFFMGAGNDNLEEVLKTDPANVCGIKVFMGSSTGNMLVDDTETLDKLFEKSHMLIATHCEDEQSIRRNTAEYIEKYGENIPFEAHPLIRDEEACLLSSSKAVALAKKHNTRLHILHISTLEELELFVNNIPLNQKRITSEVCVHHLYFDASQYPEMGSKIKCNPAIKDARHKERLLWALKNDYLDIIATDHAPHTVDEKSQLYLKAPSGLPLVQHSLQLMLSFYHRDLISLETIVEKMCHAPANCFRMEERGFLDEGYYADVVVVDPNKTQLVDKSNIHYKCGWSPLEGSSFKGLVDHTFISGHLAYSEGKFDESQKGMRLRFKPLD